MQAAAGDRLHFPGNVVGVPDHSAVILEAGGDGGPPYRVRYNDGREAVVYPGADAWVEHPTQQSAPGT